MVSWPSQNENERDEEKLREDKGFLIIAFMLNTHCCDNVKDRQACDGVCPNVGVRVYVFAIQAW